MAQRVTRSGGRRRWPWVLTLALLVVPTAELAIILWVGQQIGGWPTLGLLVAESALGAPGGQSWASNTSAKALGCSCAKRT